MVGGMAALDASPEPDRRLLDALLTVASGLDLEPTLHRIVEASATLVGAPYAALGVLGADGLRTARPWCCRGSTASGCSRSPSVIRH